LRRFLLFCCLGISAAAQIAFHADTTLAAQTGNNTSASDAVGAYTSQHAASGNVSKVPLRSLLYPGAKTRVFAALMAWFGKSGHIAVGYNSQSSTQVKKQVEDMRSRGIEGAIVAWYGKDSYENKATLQLMAQAEAHPGFQFMIMIDHGAIQWDSMGLQPTDALIAHLNYIADTYYASPAYARLNGRPLVMEFAMESYPIDWVRVRNSIKGNPMVIFRNPNGYTRPLSDGAYSWEPEKTSLSYLDYFYSQSAKYPGMQTFGSFSPSFNDSLATWTANRYADPQCGQLWLRKAAETNKYWSASKPLPFVQVATWNDYEEGSTIESGIDNCLDIQAQASGTNVTWQLSGIGNENTVDHYALYLSRDGVGLMHVGDVATGNYAFDAAALNIEPGNYTAYVQAVGKPSLLNHMSNAVPLNIAVATPAPVTPPAGSPADYTLAPSTKNLTVTATQPASLVLNANWPAGFNGAVAFSCSNLPAWAQCTFSPQMLQIQNGQGSTTLVIRAVKVASAASEGMVGGLILFSLFFAVGGRTSRARRVAMILGLCAASLALSACGGGNVQSSAAPQSQTTQAASTGKVVVVATPSDSALPSRSIELDVTLN